MKRFLFIGLPVLALVGAGTYWLASNQAAGDESAGATSTKKAKTLYTCGMHPQVIQDHPGNCPICGMRLTPMRRQTVAATSGKAAPSGERKIKYWRAPMDPTYISDKPGKSPMGMDLCRFMKMKRPPRRPPTSSLIRSPFRTWASARASSRDGPLRRVIRTVGTIHYNEAALADVTTKFKGWIEKLYVDTTGQQVHRGDPLFEIYSPELYSAQVEYLLARRTTNSEANSSQDSGQDALRASARLKLKYWDISDQQIAELDQSGQPRKTLQVLAPIDGFVTEKRIVEGQMVNAGMKIYRLADLGIGLGAGGDLRTGSALP